MIGDEVMTVRCECGQPLLYRVVSVVGAGGKPYKSNKSLPCKVCELTSRLDSIEGLLKTWKMQDEKREWDVGGRSAQLEKVLSEAAGDRKVHLQLLRVREMLDKYRQDIKGGRWKEGGEVYLTAFCNDLEEVLNESVQDEESLNEET